MKRLAGDITEDTVNILWKGNYVGTLTRRENDAWELEFVFRIDWDAWDKVKPDDVIPGIDMSLRKEEYVRDHVPSFIYDYVPPKREDTPKLLAKYGLDHYDIWDVMKANKRCCSDDFRVEPVE